LWTAKKTNAWVLNKAGVKRELLDTVKARKLAWSHREETRELPGVRDNARNFVMLYMLTIHIYTYS